MKKHISNAFLIFVSATGILQFLLIPGLIWNFLWPFFLLLIPILYFLRKDKITKRSKICFALLACLFILELGLHLFSKTNTKDKNSTHELTVMSYNLFFKNKSKNNSIALIKKANPDLLFVQELTPNWERSLDSQLGKTYPFKLTKAMNGTHGIGIYAKYKITSQKFLNNSNNKPYAQIAELNFNNKSVQLINTHLASPAVAIENKENFFKLYFQNYKIRKAQLKAITKLTGDKKNKHNSHLMVGDLNTMKYEPLYKKLKLNWNNSHSLISNPTNFNFPHSSKIPPVLTLDYIFGKGEIDIMDTKVIKGGSSDHLAIISNIKI